MIRVDLLRALGASPQAPPPPAPRGCLRPLLGVLLIVILGAGLVFLAAPRAFDPLVARAARFWAADAQAHADSLRLLAQRHEHASRLVEARLLEAVSWLDEWEAALASAAPGALSISRLDRAASGAFAFEGAAQSAEALSALQEALVLIPGMTLRESGATENPARPGTFSFRFAGVVAPASAGEAGMSDESAADALDDSTFGARGDSAAPTAETSAQTTRTSSPADSTGIGGAEETAGPIVRPAPRVVAASTLPAELETLLENARAAGLTLSAPREGSASRIGGLRATTYRLKGLFAAESPGATFAAGDSAAAETALPSASAALRALLEHEFARGGPFAAQRFGTRERDGQTAVFLDIVALSP